MKIRLPLFVVAVTSLSFPLLSQTHYELDFSAHLHHQITVKMQFELASQPNSAQPLVLQMANASPGRYARHDFAKNIYQLQAFDHDGHALVIERTGPSSWQVVGGHGPISVSYQLFGNHADGTYNQIDSRHVHLNMPASLLYAPALQDQPVVVSISALPAQWRVATQLQPKSDGGWQADNLDLLMDSPLEASAHHYLQFTQRSKQHDYQIELALHQQGSVAEAEVLLEKLKAVVAEQQAIFGELPPFANQRYTFIADYLPGVQGDGMEHRNSTIVTDDESLAQRSFGQIGTLSHEFFHSWNVERLRPKNLQPFDYTKPNMSDALWFAEGFTNYYGKLALVRSGHYSVHDYLDKLAVPLNKTLQAPGRRWYGPAAMSQQAVFVDAGVSIDANNFANSYLSYYTYGEVVALALDLQLRSEFNTDLDSLMRLLWQRFGRNEQPYQLADIEQALADVSGDADFARTFFADSIQGPALPDFTPLLAQFGLDWQLEDSEQAWLGPLELENSGDALQVMSMPLSGTPWAVATVSPGDLLLKLGSVRLRNTDDLATALKSAKPGDELLLTLRRYDEPLTLTLRVGANPNYQLKAMTRLKPTMKKARELWLGSKKNSN